MWRKSKVEEEPLTEWDGAICTKMPTTTEGMLKLYALEAKASRQSMWESSFMGRFISFGFAYYVRRLFGK